MMRSLAMSLIMSAAVAAFVFAPAGTVRAQESAQQSSEAASDAAAEATAIAKGQELVEKHCARCHAIGSKDKSKHEQAPPFREVATRYPPEHLAEALAEGIQSGHPDMPVFIFEPPQIDAFLAYLNELAPKNDER